MEAIISLLLGAGFYFVGDTFSVGVDARLRADFQSLDQKLKTYQWNNGFLPTTEQGLQALVNAPQGEPHPTRWHRLADKTQKDPWGVDYIYIQPGVRNPDGYDLYSAGKDRKAGTADDVGPWDLDK